MGEITDLWTKIKVEKNAHEHLSGLKTRFCPTLSLQDAACFKSWSRCFSTLMSQETRARHCEEETGVGGGGQVMQARAAWLLPHCLSLCIHERRPC